MLTAAVLFPFAGLPMRLITPRTSLPMLMQTMGNASAGMLSTACHFCNAERFFAHGSRLMIDMWLP